MIRLHSLKGLLDLCLGSHCLLCERFTDQELCQDCQRQVQHCQLREPDELWDAPFPVFAWGNYSGALKRAIATVKYDQCPSLMRPLGHWLGHAWLQSASSRQPGLTVVPIPMYKDKKRQRGFDQAELLAQAFCECTGLTLQSEGLVRTRATEAQFGLSIERRTENLQGAFQVGRGFRLRPPSKAVLLIDDIYTTGATAHAATLALHQHQITVYGLVAMARPTLGRGKYSGSSSYSSGGG